MRFWVKLAEKFDLQISFWIQGIRVQINPASLFSVMPKFIHEEIL
jgi:hypothetical protein